MGESNDLWPNFEDVPKITSPRAILTEQANFLSEKTQNLLSARISSGTTSEGKIFYKFSIIAPLLKNYTYNLFTLIHGAFYYPCDIRFSGIYLSITNEVELKEKLKEIFNADDTKKVIVSLLGQSKDLQ